MQTTTQQLYQIKEVARSAGISTRTLHYYDEIGLLPPSWVADNGYRYYDEQALLRLQQILLFREFDFPLAEIQAMLHDHEFDTLKALDDHKNRLLREMKRLENMLNTIDHTIEFIKGERKMTKNEFFNPEYDPIQQTEYEEEISQKYGASKVKQSQQRWGSYSQAKRHEIMAEGNQITQAIFDHMSKGFAHPDVQAEMERYHKFMFYFYDCSLEVFAGLGSIYNEDPRFRMLYEAKHADFPAFMMQAMQYYAAHHQE